MREKREDLENQRRQVRDALMVELESERAERERETKFGKGDILFSIAVYVEEYFDGR